jgi:hypothetical protein
MNKGCKILHFNYIFYSETFPRQSDEAEEVDTYSIFLAFFFLRHHTITMITTNKIRMAPIIPPISFASTPDPSDLEPISKIEKEIIRSLIYTCMLAVDQKS